MNDEYFDTLFATTQVMAILRGFGPERSVELARRAWAAGIAAVEIPLQSDRDVLALRATVAAGRDAGHPVGAGTIVSADGVRQAVAAGAAFAVSPGTDPCLMAACRDAGLPQLPGVASASDIGLALAAGTRWMKAFPASVLGTPWLRAMAGPFPQVHFVATGGVDAGNAGAFLQAGARVVAVGSALEDPQQLELLRHTVRARLDTAGASRED